jgi:catechol 2,3-dioxygenase-like lactoylglutathione lyase family enzyme
MRPSIHQTLLFLPTRDLEVTDDCYRVALGCELVRDQGRCRVYRWHGESFVGFCLADAPLAEAQRVLLSFETDDLAGWHERCLLHGLSTDGPPRPNPEFRLDHFFTADPNGYRLEFQRLWEPLH